MEPIAYGALGLTPAEFGAMTPREFAVMAAAIADQRNEDREFFAALVQSLVGQLLSRKPKTLGQMLGNAYSAWRLLRDQRRHEQTRRAEE